MLSALAQNTSSTLANGNMALVAKPVLPVQKVMRIQAKSKEFLAEASAEDLMSAVAERRDRAAFVRLFELFGPRVKAYLIRQGADGATAEDLVQDVMLTVWHRAAQYDRRKAAFSTWVFTIARNRRIDILRRAKRPEIDPEDPALAPDPEEPADPAVRVALIGDSTAFGWGVEYESIYGEILRRELEKNLGAPVALRNNMSDRTDGSSISSARALLNAIAWSYLALSPARVQVKIS